MRIGELSSRTGVPVPTIKYYVREGLLPAGLLSSPNQARYEEAHERRLRLIRGLLEVGKLPLSAIGEVLRAIDDQERSVHKLLGSVADLLVPGHGGEADAETDLARAKVARIIERRGWQADAGSAAGEALAAALAALERAGHGGFAEVLDAYAEAAELVARADLAYVAREVAREDLVESVAVGTVLGDTMFAALRRLAQTDTSSRVYGTAPPD
ncbi:MULTISPECIES: MerR family transcriptional regulator [unclassified Streptomyces]|uniref:MerR family transcriptional regulator n=1 Tax=unclassified Streptomyces TaxID=2593676 RepID=UPI000DC7AAFA|nr:MULTISPECIES: MerR family transcriptional regulator [unclassified Streptomyces]AWZ07729.1 MerR family transcriptional regulator [Streptomyces sp. ICC4]AWZ15394.1 MerR family transcriptional regulator [Streptomyces sp. ICC1]